ncbi:MAG: DUF4266 domain-containing protein [Methylococcales bacterium]
MINRLINQLILWISFGIVIAMLNGCGLEVAAWERGNLAKPHMALDPEPTISVLREHVQVSKESTSGGSSNNGGGCGCN